MWPKRPSELTYPDGLQALLALFLIYWTYRYAGGVDTLAVVSAGLIGLGLLATALARVAREPGQQDVATLVLAVVALLSPLILGFTDVSGAKGLHVKVGLVVLIMTGLRMAVRDFGPAGKAV